MSLKPWKRKIMRSCRKWLSLVRRIGLQNRNFTIISNNCTGGYVYQYFGLKYNSPTAGLFFSTKDFVKFCENFNYYLTKELCFDGGDIQGENGNQNKYPIGMLDDIKIHFLHYKSIEEARDKWRRRIGRINLDSLCFLYCENADCEEKDLEKFCAIHGFNTLCFTYNDYNMGGTIYCPELAGTGNCAWTRKIVMGLVPWKKYLNSLK